MRLQNTFEKQEETKKLLEENLKVSKATLNLVEKTRKYIFWAQVASWIKIMMVLTPIILAIIYLPSLLEKWREQIQRFISPLTDIGAMDQFQGAKDILEQINDINK